MSCTEVALLRIPKSTTKLDLSESEVFRRCLRTVAVQPGCLGVTWGLPGEDPTVLVWLVYWQTVEDHTERFVKSEAYPAFEKDLTSLLVHDKPLIAKDHFRFSVFPGYVPSHGRHVVEMLAISLRAPEDMHFLIQSMKPITDHHGENGRHWTSAPSLEPGVNKWMYIVAWESVEEHKKIKMTPFFQEVFTESKKVWKNVELFGHVLLQPVIKFNEIMQ